MIYEPKDASKIEEHFKQYLSVSYPGTPPEQMHPMQLKTAKEAFYAAWGQCIVNSRDYVGSLPPQDAINCMVDMQKQVVDFFTEQAGRKN